MNYVNIIRKTLIRIYTDELTPHEKEAEERVNTIFGEILDTFEIYGEFLTNINEEQIGELMDWILFYAITPIMELEKQQTRIDNSVRFARREEPSKAIKKDIKTIENFEKLIIDLSTA